MFLAKIIDKIRGKILHYNFSCKIFSLIPKNTHKYISKKSIEDFLKKIDEVSLDIAEYNRMAINSFFMEDFIPIKERMIELHVICSSIYNIDGVHDKTIDHLSNVRDYVNHICCYLSKNEDYKEYMTHENIGLISMAGFMHDISKLIIDHEFLYKKEKFNEKEKMFMKYHPIISGIMIDYIKEKNPHLSRFLNTIKIASVEHHENLDGSGYPAGKKNGEISLGGRIIRVADSFEAMMSHKREYQTPIEKRKAVGEIMIKDNFYESGIVLALQSFVNEESFRIERIILKNFEVVEEKVLN